MIGLLAALRKAIERHSSGFPDEDPAGLASEQKLMVEKSAPDSFREEPGGQLAWELSSASPQERSDPR
jgi:hypothetical protein